jgi:hypothetical protein
MLGTTIKITNIRFVAKIFINILAQKCNSVDDITVRYMPIHTLNISLHKITQSVFIMDTFVLLVRQVVYCCI